MELKDFKYKEISNGIKITKYLGTSKDVIIPNEIDGKKVINIGNMVFNKKELTDITIYDGVKSIGDCAFRNNKLTNITIPKSVTSIGNKAFANNKLTSVFIPKNVINLDENAFDKGIRIIRVRAIPSTIEIIN